MNISLPDNQVCQRGYSTSSEYVRDLIRNDQMKQAEQQLTGLLREGLESSEAMPTDVSYWDKKRQALKEKHAQ